MAVVIVLLACVAVAVTMAGGDESATAPSSVSDAATAQQMASTTDRPTTDVTEVIVDPGPASARFNETITFWDTTMTVSAPEILADEAVQALAGDGMEIYVVFVTIVNASGEVRDYNLFYWEAKDEGGASYDASLYLERQPLDSGEIQPGETVKGYVGFEIPKGNTVSTVTYSPLLAEGMATWEQ